MMNQYHFSDLSSSDRIVPATMVTSVADGLYHLNHKTYPDIYIRNRGMAMHLSLLPNDSDEIKALRETVEEYNEYLTKLEAMEYNLFYLDRYCCKSHWNI